MLDENLKSVLAYAPASSANCIVGYDILGFSFAKIGDHVKLIKNNTGMRITEIESVDTIPCENNKNIVSILIQKIADDKGFKPNFDIEIKKGIPVGSGLGGSAASIVATLMALNEFLKDKLSKIELLNYAAWGESQISGAAHLDNALPAMFGGFCLLNPDDPIDYLSLPIPEKLFAVIVYPKIKIETKYSRQVIKDDLSIHNSVRQNAHLARFIHYLFKGDKDKSYHFEDLIAEPHRKNFLIAFDDLKRNVIADGAIGFSFSGSGPTLLAFCQERKTGSKIQKTIEDHLEKYNIIHKSWIYKLNDFGAKVLEKESK